MKKGIRHQRNHVSDDDSPQFVYAVVCLKWLLEISVASSKMARSSNPGRPIVLANSMIERGEHAPRDVVLL